MQNSDQAVRAPGAQIPKSQEAVGGNHAVSGLKFRILRRFLVLGYAVRCCCGLIWPQASTMCYWHRADAPAVEECVQKSMRKRLCGMPSSASCQERSTVGLASTEPDEGRHGVAPASCRAICWAS